MGSIVEKKYFVLGVGAQKAGTTWLHSYLSTRRNADFGAIKEYHIWDALSSNLFDKFKVPAHLAEEARFALSIRYRMQNECGFYAAYFNSLFDAGCSLSGDITPSYAALTSGDFKKVADCISAIKARPRVIFIMRDPMERCWSVARMQKAQTADPRSDDELVAERFATEGCRLRTQYERTIACLKNAFSEEDLYFGLYENMHEEAEVTRLSDFVNVSPDFSMIPLRVNPSPKKQAISADTIAKVKSYYRTTYEFCSKAFPETQRYWSL